MRTILSAILFFILSTLAYASQPPVKTFVDEFKIVGAPQHSDLKTVLPAILSARLNPETFSPVEKKESADIQILGSYVVFGTIFTLDATVKSSDSRLYLKAFEQGEKEEEIPAAIGRLADKLAAALNREMARIKPPSAPLQPARPEAAAPAVIPPAPLTAATAAPLADPSAHGFREIWTSQPLDGALVGIAAGRMLSSSDRELFIASEKELYYYQLGKELKLVAKTSLPGSYKIIGIDSADLDNDGKTEIYLTAIDRGTVSSRVFIADGDRLEKAADSLPYFFRSSRTGTGPARILVQEMGVSSDFYGELAELVKSGTKFTTKNPVKLNGSDSIYGYTPFEADGAKKLLAVLDSKGYLNIRTESGDRLWQSPEAYGGSEAFFKREAPDQQRTNMGEEFRWVFLQQRAVSPANGMLLLPRNDGSFVVGNMRSYSKHSLHLLKWNGSSFRELQKTALRPGYLADYSYDPETKELITLEVAQKEGLAGKGSSIITILTVEP